MKDNRGIFIFLIESSLFVYGGTLYAGKFMFV